MRGQQISGVGAHLLDPGGSNGVFYDGESHYYIDGAVEMTGQLNVLRYDVATRVHEGVTVG